MSLAVASRYARALVDLVSDPRHALDADEVVKQLEAFDKALAESSDLRTILLSPAITAAKKRGIVARLAELAGVSRLVRNFLFVLIDHRRVNLLGDIRVAVQALLDERLGIVRAQVTSAIPLEDRQRAELTAQLERLTGKSVRCDFSTDASLLGGVIAKIGSTTYDGSVRGQLRALRRQLVAEA
ncbi:MAG: ATP synthase F1 subunit delta [Bryobacteraceae bacterium]|jgi:ATP synthase, F1 delta subunit|nr:ATP synthase F1 subunit delta [Bryobacteraceae bacterium]